MTHFGASEDVDAQLSELSARLDDWAARAREQDLDAFIAGVRAEIARRRRAGDLLETYEQAAPPDQLLRRASSGTGASAPRPVALRADPEARGILGRMSQTVELPRLGGPGSGLGGLWRVVVLNDDLNTFDHVAETLSRVIPGVTLAQGYRLADRIHKSGLRDRVERPARRGRGVLGAARRRRADDGAARVGW